MRVILLAGAAALVSTAALANGHEDQCFDKGTLTYFDCPTEDPNFTGVYIGIDAGVAGTEFIGVFDGDNGANDTTTADSAVFLDTDDTGYLLGAHVGAAYQFESDFVLGVEADAAFVDLDALAIDNDNEDELVAGEIDFIASVRGRAGYAFGDFMPYITGGVGFVDYEYDISNDASDPTPDADDAKYSELVVAGVAGGGFELLLTESASIRLEGLYYFSEDEIALTDDVPNDADQPADFVAIEDLWTVRGGVSFKF